LHICEKFVTTHNLCYHLGRLQNLFRCHSPLLCTLFFFFGFTNYRALLSCDGYPRSSVAEILRASDRSGGRWCRNETWWLLFTL